MQFPPGMPPINSGTNPPVTGPTSANPTGAPNPAGLPPGHLLDPNPQVNPGNANQMKANAEAVLSKWTSMSLGKQIGSACIAPFIIVGLPFLVLGVILVKGHLDHEFHHYALSNPENPHDPNDGLKIDEKTKFTTSKAAELALIIALRAITLDEFNPMRPQKEP